MARATTQKQLLPETRKRTQTPNKTSEHNKRHSKIDVSEALKLRLVNGLSYAELARKYNCSQPAVLQRLKPFEKLLDGDHIQAYQDNAAKKYKAIESNLVLNMADPKKVEAASINNLAYASKQIYEMHRLETDQSTQNIGVNLELIERAKEYRKRQEITDNPVDNSR